ncbi:hypothetical protein ACK35_21245 [Salmonella enterica subsp. arizonae]|uniref:Uncharacterized protein n=1 Tax=Salmonella enterica subsp. arizonae serovar 18:z4,z23:- TaxID=1192839 RepID=A0A5W3DXH9_SALER|nr:hypothetical protein [Salmonella enterica]EAC0103993.1 hypothetical protein [Salmonella enterica subsp. arizonae]EBV8290162.1 hypothetical protein [Salmonella enterica subsp. arizonae serovar 18:z4,z23:-]EBV9814052.1 hypothetical protein [Salmonella enterica subsp. enterica serovar Heidelberg]ECE0069731.1 hypothetical protein [Salmonella enterica subsp. enterica]
MPLASPFCLLIGGGLISVYVMSMAVASNRTLAVISPQKTLQLCCHHSRLFWNTSESDLF